MAAAAEQTEKSRKKEARFRPPPEILELKKRRKETLARFEMAASEVHLQVMQTGRAGFGKSLLLSTTNRDYLFNCPENTERLTSDNNCSKFRNLEHAFFTGASWDHIGGFPGITLRMGSSGSPGVTVHGPPLMRQMFDTVRPFADVNTSVAFVEAPLSDKFFQDKVIRVEYVPLTSAEPEPQTTFSNRPLPPMSEQTREEALVKSSLLKFEKAVRAAMSGLSPTRWVAYMCHLMPRPGKMDLVRCRQLGVSVGPLLGKLQSGESVVLPNGNVVEPNQVMDLPVRPPKFAVVEVPTPDFLPAFLKAPEFAPFLEPDEENFLDLVCHFTPADVFNSKDYQEWMEKLGSRTRHLIFNEEIPDHFPHLMSMFRDRLRRHFIHPTIFPKLPDFDGLDGKVLPEFGNVVPAEPFLKFWLRPDKGWERIDESVFYKNAVEAELTGNSALMEARKSLNAQFPLPTADEYPALTFLGTGSSMPSKYRNVSGILLELSSTQLCLFDCGEGSLSQLSAVVGEKNLDETLRNICLVFISHLHQDHHLGLFSIIRERQAAFRRAGLPYRPFYLLAPTPLARMHRLYSDALEDLGNYAKFVPARGPSVELALDEMASDLALISVRVVRVRHPMMANGIILETWCRKKIVYTGDTAFSPDLLMKDGHQPHLLIHEATFEDAMARDARNKLHCTVGQAITVGRRMEAGMTILTHFSTRYDHMPLVTTDFDERVGIAFDFMRVPLAQASLLPNLIPALMVLYRQVYEQMERRSEVRLLRQKIWAESNEEPQPSVSNIVSLNST